MDWRRSCRPGSSNQGHTQRWGTRCHSHCSKIPGYRSNSQPHSELQSYSGRFLGDSLSLQSFLPYSKFLGDRCHLRDQISAVLRWTINQKKQIQMEIFLTNNINMYNATSLYNPKRIPTAIRILSFTDKYFVTDPLLFSEEVLTIDLVNWCGVGRS